MQIVKYTSLGNHFVIVDELTEEQVEESHKAEFARSCCDPHFGIGADDVLFVQQASEPMYDIIEWEGGRQTREYVKQLHRNNVIHAVMRVFEPNGNEAAMCGNGIRCVASFLMDVHHMDSSVNILAEIPTTRPRMSNPVMVLTHQPSS